jgi:hypothetical protein
MSVFLISENLKRLIFEIFLHFSCIIQNFSVTLQPNLQRLQNMAYNKYDKLEWTLIFVSEFGKRFGLSLKQAFNYLSRYQGIAFVDSHYDYVHTQSFASMVNDMAEYCHKNGGALV